MRWGQGQEELVPFSARSHDLEKEKRLQRGCAQVRSRLASQQDEKRGSRKHEGTALAGDTQTHHKGFKWKHESKEEFGSGATLSANKCVPAMDTTEGQGLRITGEARGKKPVWPASSQPPGALGPRQEVSCKRWDRSLGGDPQGSPWGAAWKRFTDEPDRESCKRRPLWKSLHSLRGWQIHLGVSKLLRLRENVEDCGPVEPQCPQYLIFLWGAKHVCTSRTTDLQP